MSSEHQRLTQATISSFNAITFGSSVSGSQYAIVCHRVTGSNTCHTAGSLYTDGDQQPAR